MTLTAREWLLLPKEEQKVRRKELAAEECLKLRTELSEIHFSEEEKVNMSEQQKYDFTHPKQTLPKEREALMKKTQEIFKKMQEEINMH